MWKTTRIPEQEAYWGGEIAATRLNTHLKPALATVYLRKDVAQFQAKHGLKPARGRVENVELLKAFWDPRLDGDDHLDTAPLLLTYADLVAIGDPRGLEAAERIYERQIRGPLGQD